MVKLLCSSQVVSLTSFKWMKTNLLHDSAICCNRFELIAIFPTLFRKCVATINFLEYTQAFFNFWGPLSKNCPSTRFGASLPLTLREKWGPNLMFPKNFFFTYFTRKETWNIHASGIHMGSRKKGTISMCDFEVHVWKDLLPKISFGMDVFL